MCPDWEQVKDVGALPAVATCRLQACSGGGLARGRSRRGRAGGTGKDKSPYRAPLGAGPHFPPVWEPYGEAVGHALSTERDTRWALNAFQMRLF